MGEFISTMLGYGFMRNAFLAGILVSIVCGVIGTLVVLLDEDWNGRQDVALKALASAVAVGSGVSAGHLLDYLRE